MHLLPRVPFALSRNECKTVLSPGSLESRDSRAALAQLALHLRMRGLPACRPTPSIEAARGRRRGLRAAINHGAIDEAD